MIASLEAAIFRDPTDWRAFVSLAAEHAVRGSPQRTLMYLNEIRHLVPIEAGEEAHLIAELYLAVGASALALTVGREAVGIAPKSIDARLAFARALLAQGRLAEADASLRLAARIGAPPPRIRETIAFGLDVEGRFAGARRALAEMAEERERTAVESLRALLGESLLQQLVAFAADLSRIGVVEVLDFLCEHDATGWMTVRDPEPLATFRLRNGAICAVAVGMDAAEKRSDDSSEERDLADDAFGRGEIVSGGVTQGGLRLQAIETLGALIDHPNGSVAFRPEPERAHQTLRLPTRTILKLARVAASRTGNWQSTSTKAL